jgi:DNA-binding transcriptional LysR family regulator
MLDDMELFVLAAERGSFQEAAKALGLPKSTVSRRVQRLEARLGLPLLRRAGRAWSLTPDGRLLVERSRGPLHELAAVRDATLDAAELPKGTLRLAIPIELSGTSLIGSLVTGYCRHYPDVDLELLVDDRLADLVAEDVDLALRGHRGQLPDRAGLVARQLATIDAGLFASPTYLNERGTPAQTSELAGHDLLAPGLAVFGGTWPFVPEALGSPLDFEPRLRLRSNEFRSLLAAAIGGLGVAPCPLFLAREAVVDGGLVRVLPTTTFSAGSISAVWPRSRNLSPRVRSMVDFLVAHFEVDLNQFMTAGFPNGIPPS